jgi:flagellar biosynthesis chaperone FliJ
MNELTRAYQAGEITEAMYAEGMEECKEGILSNLESLVDLDKQMKEYYQETLEAAQDELSKYTDKLEHSTEVLEHYGNMMEILGKEMDYEGLGIILQGQVDTIENEMKVAEAAYEMY